MKLSYWLLTVLLLLAGGVAFYLFGDRLKARPASNSRHRIPANHLPFKFAQATDHDESPFRVDWPPQSPADGRRLKLPPLLNGRLVVSAGLQDGQPSLNVRVELTRADSDADCKRWNRQLAFPEYDWMSRVRVWDADRKWLWPNLPYLLRAYGLEREQRYGGVDPGNDVDNDFAAVVIRPVNSDKANPELITAEWFGPAGGDVDKRTIVHKAVSEDLQWNVPAASGAEGQSGVVGVWLIYADFLESAAPDSWPDTPEYSGGILAYFSIHWKRNAGGDVEIVKTLNEIPPAATGVDWPAWLASTRRF